ncbi:hypothetical protein NBT05_06120 [Aquimarina sp. ERC-38]|uniref:arsenate reductase family protein n=1 Tax=Aquimarina sp. ERC-38 TaxID=2949996 RepID=UPI002247C533|nr:ArsC/Spx/MgsR family protein [Aquimarina sp. ERC-38]UZO82043.1 hypothetical protein NBT05_06120 [Aquimarina sp. ERC-38]
MKKFFYLKTCDTCKRILSELDLPADIEQQNVKDKPISEDDLETLYQLTGSYESLFNRRSKLYREKGLHEQQLSETDYRNYILEHYTFLKRPILVINDQIFAGNSKKTVAAAKEALQ